MSLSCITIPCDSSAAQWFSTALADFEAGVVVSLVPDVFEAYVRVLHPGRIYDGTTPEGRSVTWSEIACAEERKTSAHTQWHSSEGAGDSHRVIGANWGGSGPQAGLGKEVLEKVCKVLARNTESPDRCNFGIWTGWSSEDYAALLAGLRREADSGIPQFGVPPRAGRDYFLLSGPLKSVVEMVDLDLIRTSPTYVWPADRAWCLVTDIDLDSTLIGGSDALAKEILGEDGIEAWRVGRSDAIEGF